MLLDRVDRLISAFDQSLRVVAGVVETRRPSPAPALPEAELSPQQRREAAALMRVNHAGEVCAQALYQGQAMASGDENLKRTLARAADEELDHIGWTRDRVEELGGRLSVLNPFWYAGSFLIGYAAGRMGDRVNLGFLAETERQVESHLEGHLRRLSEADQRTRTVVATMAREEAGHAAMARRLGAAELPPPVKFGMKLASRVMTTLAYRF